MAGTKTEKQAKARRFKDAYESMSDERFNALDSEIRSITSECNDDLQGAADDAVTTAVSRFYELVVRRYTEDEIEAFLKYHNLGRFEFDVCEGLRDIWNRHWLPQRDQKLRGVVPFQKGWTS
jgi:hypothetical protein